MQHEYHKDLGLRDSNSVLTRCNELKIFLTRLTELNRIIIELKGYYYENNT